MPGLAACSTCTPLPIESSRLLISLDRLLRPCAVKYSVGLSSAELTLLPVARSFWVVASSDAVDCSESRFWRTEAERTIPDMTFPSGCWSHFYDLKTDTPWKVNKSLKEAVSVRSATAMVDIALIDEREGLAG